MGNCIRGMSDECHERVVSLNGAEKEFKASTPIKRIISGRYQGYKLVQHTKPFSPLPQDSKPGTGGIYYLVPDVPNVPCKPLISIEKAKQEIRKTGILKIVITKQQLEFLLRNAKKFQSGKLAVRFSDSFEQDYRKWYPSLPPIEELSWIRMVQKMVTRSCTGVGEALFYVCFVSAVLLSALGAIF